jgi:hypothetical protein
MLKSCRAWVALFLLRYYMRQDRRKLCARWQCVIGRVIVCRRFQRLDTPLGISHDPQVPQEPRAIIAPEVYPDSLITQ